VRVKAVRLLGVVLYTGYLVHVGLLMTILPWSEAWPTVLVRLPMRVALVLDQPSVRGAISGFGVLHLLMLFLELAVSPRHRTP
jgi:hypothetical protein